MSEFCLSSSKKTQFSSLLLSDFMLFCSFILSHPLYFSYFIFFSPYLLKLLSFLSPLFITTSLLLLSLLTGFPGLLDSDHHSVPQLPESSKVGFLLTTYNTVIERLRTKLDDEDQGFHDHFEEFEAYRIVFETNSCIFEERENIPVEGSDLKSEENGVRALEAPAVKCSSRQAESEALITSNLEEKLWPEITQSVAVVKTLEGLFQEVEDSDSMKEKAEEKKVKTQGTESNKVGSKAMSSKIREMVAKFSDGNGAECTSKVVKNSRKMGANLDNADNGGVYTSKVLVNFKGSVANLDSSDNGGEITTKGKENSRSSVANLDSANNGGDDTSKVKENSQSTVANLDSGGKVIENSGDLVVHLNSDDIGGEHTLKVTENSQKLDPKPDSDYNGEEYNSKVVENSQWLAPNLGSFGSMRKEKEWKRTLACKLFEERHNVEGGEGMDLLWETYEADSYKNKTKKGKKGGIEFYEDEDEEEEEEVDAQLCCLQALKFSAGKMNLGMGRPNLLRISKALKGIGWLHHVSRHGKKG